MELLDTIRSEDNATKFVVKYHDGLVGEVTYINYPNKDIVCCPTQTACRMGCKFCFLSNEGKQLAYRDLNGDEMANLTELAIKDATPRRPLLVSFMGAGEPLLNFEEMLRAIYTLRLTRGDGDARYAFATMMPRGTETNFLHLTTSVATNRLPVKAHLSLHFAYDDVRLKYMPSAGKIKTALSLLETYRETTGRDIEVHYTLIDGVNDFSNDASKLADLLKPRDIPVKLLYYSVNPVMGSHASENVYRFKEILLDRYVKAEFYKPNGLDIGASCGQFNLDRYVRSK